MQLQFLTKKAVNNKIVILRTDYNVPLNKSQIIDDTRIERSLETIHFILAQAKGLLITAHLGRPTSSADRHLSLKPIQKSLEEKLKHKVALAIDIPAAKELLKKNKIVLLENIRFFKGEENNSVRFARDLANLADVYVNDAFSVSHRKHVSISAITRFLPSYAGKLLSQEYDYLKMLTTNPKRPFVTIVGGAKISTKVGVVSKLSQIADVVLVGGGVANHFIKAEGFDVSDSYLEEVVTVSKHKKIDPVCVAGDIIKKNKLKRMLLDDYIPLPKIIYPFDVIAADSIKNPKQIEELVLIEENHQLERKKLMFLDIGPKTQRLFSKIIAQAGTVFWNGPLGLFEEGDFSEGTRKIAHAVAKSPATTVVGGGDSISAINQLGLHNRYDYVSASGGAALEFISGKQLPGLVPLLKK